MSEFDEDDPETMIPLVGLMAEFSKDIFPESLDVNGKTIHRHLAFGRGPHIEETVRLVDQCMGPLYVSHKGKNWKNHKADELKEIGLLFIWYSVEGSSEMSALVVCKLVSEQTLYLYEIQVHPDVQNNHLGSKLMDGFHKLAKKLDETSLNDNTELDETLRWNCTTEYTGLTVFPDNEKALRWYKRLGYDHSPGSPIDRKTRLRVIKPDYYELEREVN
ncbi:hypothetical protein FT663_03175 [Candidozyma haemuli var. vulneris]|uniref:N-alpha-acetyltransferase 40 n=1 Tax=Candidozyma haemuli TaxID=45357 RepID=A0A2V1ALU0_9ASCO|nr:hypothetical protein CXQ85_000916 [[Candida] haemuloni]KAF3985204.1 hypothetical protein FT662_05293 [[Candida] haemuloni var. vulneris]KAF3990417.1 hypothetical protein FT663_03175 [[Candida] haemuloni var. vulneris]PVH18634.1 hypothetical protein CXQ85_000916 [[Candida] haemuloni]